MSSVGLFATCLVETMRPSVGLAAMRLLRQCGYEVTLPKAQSCCAQPGYNNGEIKGTLKVARQVLDCFLDFDYLVAPSASCLGMIRHHYPALMAEHGNEEDQHRASRLAANSYELIEFLAAHEKFRAQPLPIPLTVTCHDSCSSLREIKNTRQTRMLLKKQHNLSIKEMQHTEVCCGFGGTFCVKNTPISDAMADAKLNAAMASGVEILVSCDLGCLIHLASRSMARNLPLRLRHTAEILAGFIDLPALGERGEPEWDQLIQQTMHVGL